MIDKYVCIDNSNGHYNFLIIGNIYNVKKIEIGRSNNYIIYQDHLLPIPFLEKIFNRLFISLSEYRNIKINKILNNEN